MDNATKARVLHRYFLSGNLASDEGFSSGDRARVRVGVTISVRVRFRV
jgi:hypothetical protein